MASASPRVSVPAGANFSPLSPKLRSSINESLVATNAVCDIQSSLLHECQMSGFTTAIRARVVDLLRSGECTTYTEVMREVMSEIKGSLDAEALGEDAAVNGEEGEGNEDQKLKVPRTVVEEGVKKVKAALENCVDVVGNE